MKFTVFYTYFDQKKERSYNFDGTPYTFDQARAFYLRLLELQNKAPKIYSSVDCSFKHLLNPDYESQD